MTNSPDTFLTWTTSRSLGAFTARTPLAAARMAAAAHSDVDVADVWTTQVDRCMACGASEGAFDQHGGSLVCKVCGALGHDRLVDDQPGDRWALLRPGTGMAEAVSVFTGSRVYAESLVVGKLILARAETDTVARSYSADRMHIRNGTLALIDGDDFVGWW